MFCIFASNMWAPGNQWNSMPLDAASYQNVNHEHGKTLAFFKTVFLWAAILCFFFSGLGFTRTTMDSHERGARDGSARCAWK